MDGVDGAVATDGVDAPDDELDLLELPHPAATKLGASRRQTKAFPKGRFMRYLSSDSLERRPTSGAAEAHSYQREPASIKSV